MFASKQLSLAALVALAACGGGGGGSPGGEPGAASAVANAPPAPALAQAPATPPPSSATNSTSAPAAQGPAAQPPADPPPPAPPPAASSPPAPPPGPAPGDAIEEVVTETSYTLPPHIENLRVAGPGSGTLELIGNELNNRIIGAPFSHDVIRGLGGDDLLDGGGRHGGFLDGGEGNDRLLISFGEMLGGPGADTFVAAGRGAHTSPEAPITVLDFNGAQGDRIEIIHVQPAVDVPALVASGALRFDAATSTLTLDLDPSTPHPTSVDQVFLLPGVTFFDFAWVSVGSGTR